MDKGKKQLAITLTGITILVVAAFLLYYFFWPKHQWNENYLPGNKEPYGAFVFNELLQNYNPGGEYQVLKERWDSSSPITAFNRGNDNYVFIGKNCYLDSLSAQALAAFVRRGNTALFIVPQIPYEMLVQLGIHTCEEDSVEPMDTVYADSTNTSSKADTAAIDTINKATRGRKQNAFIQTFLSVPSVNLNFTHPKLQDIKGYIYPYVVDKDTATYYWDYIVSDDSCQQFLFPYAKLGTIGNEHSNFIRVKYGDGSFLFHTTPLAFSNYSLVEKKHLEYAEKVLSHLGTGNIYWDEYSRTVHMNFNKKMAAGHHDETPLRYILSQPALRWAWYLMLTLVLLYTLFQLKRRQRIIPVLETNTNTSIEFAQTVSRLYYQQNDHRKLVLQQMRLYLSFIRERYHINTMLEEPILIDRIVAKSGLPETAVNAIFGQYKHIEQMPDITHAQLVDFYQALENFYQKCK